MSTLGKILTVLVAVASIAVAVLVSREFVAREDWRAAYEGKAKQYDRALSQRDTAIEKAKQAKQQMGLTQANLQAKIDTLAGELALRNNTIAGLQEEKTNQDKRLQQLATSLEGLNKTTAELVAQRDAWRKERDDAMGKADTLTGMYAELEAKHKTALAQLQDLKEDLRQAREEKSAIESKLAWLNQNHPEVRFPEKVPAVPVRKLEGLVTNVDEAARVAEINLGSDDGVVSGMKFYVYDQGLRRYLATLTVSKVSSDSAAGELGVVRGKVETNSHVTNRFD